MNGSGIAMWLDHASAGFDFGILGALHGFAQATGGRLTGFFEAISLAGEKGAGLFLLGLLLFAFRKTRKTGFCVLGAVMLGAVATNFILKDLVGRARPFLNLASAQYRGWWIFVGSPAEEGFSFPSGHATATMAAMTVLFARGNKKLSWLWFVPALLMGVSRCYLMVHYPSDVLAGCLVGALGAGLSILLVERFYPAFRPLWLRIPGIGREEA